MKARLVVASLFLAAPAVAQEATPTATPDATATATATPVATATPAATATPIRAVVLEPVPSPTPEYDLRIGRESSKWATFEIGGGVVRPTGTVVETVYGKDLAEPEFHMRGSLLLGSIFDVGLSGGFSQITGHQVAADGTPSADVTRLTLAPFSATALVRLDFFRNQPIVPYGGGGLAYALWSERDALADEQVDGDKYGWTAVAGVQLLLDVLEPSRADDIDGFWGINDTYLTLEISRTEYDSLGKGVDGLDLSHWSARAAFLFEY